MPGVRSDTQSGRYSDSLVELSHLEGSMYVACIKGGVGDIASCFDMSLQESFGIACCQNYTNRDWD